MRTRTQIPSWRGRNKIPWYWPEIDIYLSICMEKLCQRDHRGVGILLSPRAQKSFNCIENIQLKMMAATFNGDPSRTMISCYSPNNSSNKTDLIAFYKELSSLVRSIPQTQRSNHLWKYECLNKLKQKQQIQFIQVIKQKCGTTKRFLTRKWTKLP